MPEQARRHHVVSKFYLRHFADEREQLTTVMLPGDRTFTQSITNASVQTDFYTVIDTHGNESDLAEQALSGIETPAADAWHELAAGVWPLPEEHRGAMAAWLALQILRSSGIRNSMNEIATHALLLETVIGGRRRVREALISSGEPADDESVDREWVDLFKNPLRAQVHANHHLQQLAQMLPRVTQSLLDRRWLLTIFQRKALATSDHPVFVVPNTASARMGMGTGIENATVLHAPLTRRHSLAMYLPSAVPPEVFPGGRDIRRAGVAAVALYSNSCAVNSARQFLFHHPQDAPLTGLDLPQPRGREISMNAQLWGWIPEDDRQVLLDAGFGPADLDALLE